MKKHLTALLCLFIQALFSEDVISPFDPPVIIQQEDDSQEKLFELGDVLSIEVELELYIDGEKNKKFTYTLDDWDRKLFIDMVHRSPLLPPDKYYLYCIPEGEYIITILNSHDQKRRLSVDNLEQFWDYSTKESYENYEILSWLRSTSLIYILKDQKAEEN